MPQRFERLIVGTLLLLILQSCGKVSRSQISPDGSPAVVGDILVGTQCPLGTLPQPVPGGFALHECPLESSQLELTTSPGPILLTGDCAEKTLGIRTIDGSVDTLWQIPPNGSFSIIVSGFRSQLQWEGQASCQKEMTLEIRGQMHCETRDTISLELDSMRLWLIPKTDENSCKLPSSCRLEAQMKLRQCG